MKYDYTSLNLLYLNKLQIQKYFFFGNKWRNMGIAKFIRNSRKEAAK